MNDKAKRSTLNFTGLGGEEDTELGGGLGDFPVPARPRPTPRPAAVSPTAAAAKRQIDGVSQFPSRESTVEHQMNIKAPVEVLERFRAMAKSERYKHGEFLVILMNAYEGQTGE